MWFHNIIQLILLNARSVCILCTDSEIEKCIDATLICVASLSDKEVYRNGYRDTVYSNLYCINVLNSLKDFLDEWAH